MITLYDCSTAPSPRRARILLAEKGVAHETVQVDLRRREQMGDAYRQVNPFCTVPALRTEEGLLLDDNAAITAYLEAKYPDPPLLGETPAEKAEVASWNWHVEFDGLHAVMEAFRNSSPGMVGRALPGAADHAQIPQLAERGRTRVLLFLSALDQQLASREYVAAHRFSVADITAVVTVDFALRVVKPTDPYPNVQRWRSAMALRPSMSL